MKRRISLYIGNSLVDLDSESFVLFNYTRDEASNPTIVKNSYSQSISIPGTQNNNDIFGRLFRLDSVSFNPLRKVDFVIFNELNEVLERGYARLDSISTQGAKVTYKVSLFGGLGGFFYNLMYDDEGNKKTLADIIYYENKQRGAEYTINPYTRSLPITKNAVKNAWDYLSNPSDNYIIYDLINFAPCNNGYPSFKFSTDKAVYKPGAGVTTIYPNLYNSKVVDNITYSPKTGTATLQGNTSVLLEMGESHSEWEMQDLRSYLQRPVLHFRRFVEALDLPQNSGEYSFVIDTDCNFFQDDNPSWNSVWLTLPLIDRDKVDPTTTKVSDLLKSSASPADYLISFAKVFGLVFIFDNSNKRITLTQRNSYYRNEKIDLSERISTDKEITPHTMEAKFYDFSYPSVYGEFAKNYEEKYSRKYGLQRVNTGYDFNADHEDTLKDIVFKGCADALESNGNFRIYGGNSIGEYGEYRNYEYKFAFSDSVSWKLYGKQNGKDVEITAEPLNTIIAPFNYSGDVTFKDFMARPQLHGEENKGEEGSNVLLFFEGFVDTPADVTSGIAIFEARFHLSDDTAVMLELNDGEPCYDVSLSGSNILEVYSIPSFRRWHIDNGSVALSLDLGTPMEVAVEENANPSASIYHIGWEDYIADKFSKDTRIVNLKVDFSGMKVDASLLRNFYYFNNSLWVLNKITNYSLTTYDPVECEFIKVGDTDSYIFGQLY